MTVYLTNPDELIAIVKSYGANLRKVIHFDPKVPLMEVQAQFNGEEYSPAGETAEPVIRVLKGWFNKRPANNTIAPPKNGTISSFTVSKNTTLISALEQADKILGSANVSPESKQRIINNTKALAALGDRNAEKAVMVLNAARKIREATNTPLGQPAIKKKSTFSGEVLTADFFDGGTLTGGITGKAPDAPAGYVPGEAEARAKLAADAAKTFNYNTQYRLQVLNEARYAKAYHAIMMADPGPTGQWYRANQAAMKKAGTDWGTLAAVPTLVKIGFQLATLNPDAAKETWDSLKNISELPDNFKELKKAIETIKSTVSDVNAAAAQIANVISTTITITDKNAIILKAITDVANQKIDVNAALNLASNLYLGKKAVAVQAVNLITTKQPVATDIAHTAVANLIKTTATNTSITSTKIIQPIVRLGWFAKVLKFLHI